MKTRTKLWFITTILFLCILYKNRSTPAAKGPVSTNVANSTGVYELTDAELEKIELRFSRRRNRLRSECREQGHEVPEFKDIEEKLLTWQLNQIFHDTSLNMSGRWSELINVFLWFTSWSPSQVAFHPKLGQRVGIICGGEHQSSIQKVVEPIFVYQVQQYCSSIRFFPITRKRLQIFVCKASQNPTARAVYLDDTAPDWAAYFWLEQYTLSQKLPRWIPDKVWFT